MPVIYSFQSTSDLCLAVWQIEETEADILDQHAFDAAELAVLESIRHPKRRLQWLCSRLLIDQVYPGAIVAYHAHGKPFLHNGPYVSISHTTGYAAVALGKTEVGIDIQAPDEKLLRVAQRFSSNADLISFPEMQPARQYQYIWAIKEAVFKTYGTGLPFKEGIVIKEMSADLSWCSVRIMRNGSTAQHTVHLKAFSDTVLACLVK